MSHWSEELFVLMVDKLIERKKREISAIKKPDNVIPEDQFFKQAGIKVKHGN